MTGALEKMKEHPEDLELQAMLQETANIPAQLHPYRGYTVVNKEEQATDVQVGLVTLPCLIAHYFAIFHSVYLPINIWR